MEQEEHNVDPQYLKGFNGGYLLSKHEPALAAKLIANPNEHNPYFSGMVAGTQQYDKEIREWAKGHSKGAPAKDDRDIDRER